MFKDILINDENDLDKEIYEFRKKIEERNVTVYVNKFSEESAKQFYEDFSKAHKSGQSIIPILIDSYGGSVHALISMMDIIKSSDKPVATISLGKAMSCGSILLSCGNEGMRYMSPSSTVMIHHVSAGARGKTGELKVTVKEADRLQDLIFNAMDENCGHSKGYFLNLVRDNLDLYLTPDECIKHNLVNHIKLPRFQTTIKVETNLV